FPTRRSSDLRRKFFLIAKSLFVEEINTAQPVTINNISMALYIILATGKIPHKVSPIHPVYLITEKETQILNEGRFVDDGHLAVIASCANGFSFKFRPLFIFCYVVRLGTVHPGEQAFELRIVIIF